MLFSSILYIKIELWFHLYSSGDMLLRQILMYSVIWRKVSYSMVACAHRSAVRCAFCKIHPYKNPQKVSAAAKCQSPLEKYNIPLENQK